MNADREGGSLAVLNTGAGDINVTFNDADDAEAERAIGMLLDMQKRGYAIMVRQPDGTYLRAVSIDRATKSYVVLPPTSAPDEPAAEPTTAPRRGRRRVKQPIATGHAVGVARSAGGCARRSPHELLGLARRPGAPRTAELPGEVR